MFFSFTWWRGKHYFHLLIQVHAGFQHSGFYSTGPGGERLWWGRSIILRQDHKYSLRIPSFFCVDYILGKNCEHLSPFPRLPDSILWRRAEALVLMVIVTTATKELKCLEVTILTLTWLWGCGSESRGGPGSGPSLTAQDWRGPESCEVKKVKVKIRPRSQFEILATLLKMGKYLWSKEEGGG